jgi:hypothetical protein
MAAVPTEAMRQGSASPTNIANPGPDRRRISSSACRRNGSENMSREMQILLGYELLRPAHIMGQVSGYHPSKTLDPEFVLPVLR